MLCECKRKNAGHRQRGWAHLISKKLYYNLGRQLQIDEGRIIFNEPILRKALSFLHQLIYVKKTSRPILREAENGSVERFRAYEADWYKRQMKKRGFTLKNLFSRQGASFMKDGIITHPIVVEKISDLVKINLFML